MKRGLLLALLAGLAAATATAAVIGLKDVLQAIGAIGWRGLATLVAVAPIPILILATAWRMLTPEPGASLAIFAWARAVRDGAGELLPFSHLGGFVAGARAAMLGGIPARRALATSVADVTTELIAQLGFTALGLVMLVSRFAAGGARQSVLIAAFVGLALTAAGAVAFILIQRRGGHLVEALARRLLPAQTADQVGDLSTAIAALYDRPWRVAAASAVHLMAWLASALGVWLALRVAGIRIDPMAVISIEALVAAARSVVVIAPMGLGVQEATYAVVGPLFGLPAELSLAISLIRRARDLLVGGPPLAVWQAMEGAKAVRRRSPAAAPQEPAAR
ncbi:MAG TPA: lysylphosphatidylglycerol synthase domain-containing protein [Caulobacteraceae bacterium]|nr:lysylphosphatidylglycerol synthase domain-containing protein [Caulobacteraceae bacterium]